MPRICNLTLTQSESLERLLRAAAEAIDNSSADGAVVWEASVRVILLFPILRKGEEARAFDVQTSDGVADVRTYFLPILLGMRIRDWISEKGAHPVIGVGMLGTAGVVRLRTAIRPDASRAIAYTSAVISKWGNTIVLLLSQHPKI